MAEFKTTTARPVCNYHGGWGPGRAREGISWAEMSLIKPPARDFYLAVLALRSRALIPSLAEELKISDILRRKMSKYPSSR